MMILYQYKRGYIKNKFSIYSVIYTFELQRLDKKEKGFIKKVNCNKYFWYSSGLDGKIDAIGHVFSFLSRDRPNKRRVIAQQTQQKGAV